MMVVETSPNTTATLGGDTYLHFSGTSYLGVSMLPDFQALVCAGIQTWGASFGSSRNANLKLAVYEEGERFLAHFLATEAAVTVSSGTLASRFALRAMARLTDRFYHMPKAHPSIVHSASRPVFTGTELHPDLQTVAHKSICIVADAVATLETGSFSFDFLENIAATTTIYLLLDESHSLGVLGKNGNGIASTIATANRLKIVVVSSLGKAFGLAGGVIAGDTELIDLIKKDPLFIGSAGMSPAFLESFVAGQAIYAQQQEKLLNNIAYVYERLAHVEAVVISKNYPVFFFKHDGIAAYLQQQKILITSFYYPTTSQKINRIVINANHTKAQLAQLVKNLMEFSQQ